jgi:hypothetical protein
MARTPASVPPRRSRRRPSDFGSSSSAAPPTKEKPKDLRASLHERFAGWLERVAGDRIDEQRRSSPTIWSRRTERVLIERSRAITQGFGLGEIGVTSETPTSMTATSPHPGCYAHNPPEQRALQQSASSRQANVGGAQAHIPDWILPQSFEQHSESLAHGPPAERQGGGLPV